VSGEGSQGVTCPRSLDTFDAVFDGYAAAVLRYARRRLDSEDAAWDVVSDTFVVVWRHWERRPATPDLLPWLYAIAANAVRNQRRAAGRQDRLVLRLSAARHLAPAPDPADGVVLRRTTQDALARLSETDREVLRLIGWEGLTDARSVGLVLGLSPVAARSRIHRARRRLKALLAEPADPPAAAAEVSAPPAGRNRPSEA
jgi:RNA polymerase sigma-70 factor (ECF subfamily)